MSIEAGDSMERTCRPRRVDRWIVPAFSLAIGVGGAVVFLARHDPGAAASWFLILAAYGLVLVTRSRRSEAVALLRGETTDERGQAINQRAAAMTGYVLIAALVIGYAVELVRGHDVQPWELLCSLGGGTYILATVLYSRRG